MPHGDIDSTFAYDEIFEAEEMEHLEKEFPNLEGECYLDHTGATLFSKTQIHNVYEDMKNSLYSNPHSRNPSSSITTDAIDSVRHQILAHFGTTEEEYSIIFSSGATGAMKLLAESFDSDSGVFVYLEESHTSVIGMREIFAAKGDGSKVICISKLAMDKCMDEYGNTHQNPYKTVSMSCQPQQRNGLVAYPAQCNFSGYKYPLYWNQLIIKGSLDLVANSKEFFIEDFQSLHESVDADKPKVSYNWFTFLDAASYVGTSPLNLQANPVDFVAISFYKLFGYPTGLGALIVKNSSSDVLKSKIYFGGGTVNIALPSKQFHVKRKKLHERLEDGTISFLSIIALRHGFEQLAAVDKSMSKISIRVFRLAQYFYRSLLFMKYSNGQRVVQIYTDSDFQSPDLQGGVVTFNLLRPNGSFIGYSEMEQIAYLNNVHLRYGCFCNPGACRRHLNYCPEDIVKHYEAGHVCGDMKDLIDGNPTGCIRVSFGYMTRIRDAELLLDLIRKCWVIPANGNLLGSHKFQIDLLNSSLSNAHCHKLNLKRIYVYPVKSCGGFQISKSWTIGHRGLLYDREWIIVTSSGVPLTQKRESLLCKIQTKININNRVLELSMEGFSSVFVPLTVSKEFSFRQTNLDNIELCNSKVCGDTIYGLNCGPEVNSWLNKVLNRTGLKLIRMLPDFHRNGPDKSPKNEISLANHSQFLLITQSSLEYLAKELWNKNGISFGNNNLSENNVTDKETVLKRTMENLELRFRPNFVVNSLSGDKPFQEDYWSQVRIGPLYFQSGGPCMRCATICMDQTTGERTSEPILTLSAIRSEGGPRFGIHLYSDTPNHNSGIKTQVISTGWDVQIFTEAKSSQKSENNRITVTTLKNIPLRPVVSASVNSEYGQDLIKSVTKIVDNID